MMAIKIVFGILLCVAGIVLIIISFSNFYKYLVQKKKCTSVVLGEVIGYSLHTPSLPKVAYETNGRKYKVVGPRFKAIITKTVTTPLDPIEGNVNSYVDEKMRLHVSVNKNAFGAAIRSPLSLLYPIGTKVNVYFDPENPRNAFVERYCDLKWLFWLTIGFGILCLIGSLVVVMMV